MEIIREPAVAGSFYPANPLQLRSMLQGYLAESAAGGPPPKAMIVPHAGYIYSGPVAASGYARLQQAADHINRVILLGPAHRVAFRGLAVPNADGFRTPLGVVPVDKAAIDEILALPQVHTSEEAHRQEHSLEVHLPFLQATLNKFTLVPLVVGDATPAEVSEIIGHFWDSPGTLIIISSDLSHYHDYETAVKLDNMTSRAIENLALENIGYDDACGRNPVNGLLLYARQHGLAAKTIDLRNSGDTAGPRDQVVGYGTYVINQ
ncbi:MAG: AmmeMemoRadiSam system protein B [Gammaproteobacteria bacterium]